MRLLLDTQVWLWMLGFPDRLSAEARELLEASANELLLSAASSWEVAIKYALGKLSLPDAPASYVPSAMGRSGVRGLAVEHAHALHVSTLPPEHRDPFDRVLVAQAQIEDLALMTSDAIFERYEVEVIPAS